MNPKQFTSISQLHKNHTRCKKKYYPLDPNLNYASMLGITKEPH